MSVPTKSSYPHPFPQTEARLSTEHRLFVHSLERERRVAVRALDRHPVLAPISPAQGARHRAELATALGLDHDDTPREAIVR